MSTVWGLSIAVLSLLLHGGSTTPLDDYVNRPDPTYKYDILQSVPGPGYTLYTVNMTSQTWKPDLQSQPIWWHYMLVTVPDVLKITDAAFVYISGGSNENAPPSMDGVNEQLISLLGQSTGTISAILYDVPNQPIVFKNDPSQKQRTEDAIIAWTWRMFIEANGSDPEILARMPMTKAVVRALDTINDLSTKLSNNIVDRFVVGGESKRGWTTWTVGAVDERVVAIAPVVMDLLNLVENLHHMYRSLGGWTFEFANYYDEEVTSYIDDPAVQKLADIVDPISYNDRYATKPKYIVTTAGDEFFFPDDTTFYLDQLKGETHLRMIPNADHFLNGQEVSLFFGLRSWYMSVITGSPRPMMSWNLEHTSTGGKIVLKVDTEPESVVAWYATTRGDKRKDFRLQRLAPINPPKPELQPVLWYPKCAQSLGNGTYSVELQNPSVGWTAFFIQATFPGIEDSVLEFTTETLIIPDTYPFQDCHGADCKGVLV